MKKFSINHKYFALIFTLIITGFVFTHDASADTYVYNCNAINGGGTVTSEVNLAPGSSPYVFGSNQSFNATGKIYTSNCSVTQVSLTARNNFGADLSLILPTAISSNNSAGIPLIPASRSFTAPATVCSSYLCPYSVSFVTGVDEPLPVFALASAAATSSGSNNPGNYPAVVCSAGITLVGVPGFIDLRYDYIYMQDSGSPWSAVNQGYCTVNIDPLRGDGNNEPGISYQVEQVDVLSYCWLNASFPVDPSIPQCQ